MKKKWLLVAGLVLALGIIGLTGCEQDSASLGEITTLNMSSQQQGIWVSGEGEVSIVPDIAILRLGIEVEKSSVAEVQTQATEAMDEVMTALTQSGVAEKDIQTQYFSIYQVTRWDSDKQEEVVTGYRVTNMVTARIRDVEEVGSVIDAVALAGGDYTRIDSISFSVDEPSEYYEEAREEAMADAEAKAEQLAQLAGVSLGEPTYISESIYVPYSISVPRAAYAMEEAAVGTSISPGETEISLSVQVSYSIK
ncbi:SIMPL domain-containing protein [Chloroflexota bacterium]